MKNSKKLWETEVTKYTSKWNHYFEIYDLWFKKFRNKSPIVLEIGIDCGGSLEGWKKYFGDGSKIIGFDNRPKFEPFDDIQLVVGNQGDPGCWERFIQHFPHVDIVIDDGSHYMWDQICTFEHVFPTVNEGGIYLIEDTHSSYWNDKMGNPPSAWGGGYKEPHTCIEFMKNMIDVLHDDHIPRESPDFAYLRPFINLYRSVKAIHFYDSVIVIEKGLRPKHEVHYVNRDKSY